MNFADHIAQHSQFINSILISCRTKFWILDCIEVQLMMMSPYQGLMQAHYVPTGNKGNKTSLAMQLSLDKYQTEDVFQCKLLEVVV